MHQDVINVKSQPKLLLLYTHQHSLDSGPNAPGGAKLEFAARWNLTVGNKMKFKILKPFWELRKG